MIHPKNLIRKIDFYVMLTNHGKSNSSILDERQSWMETMNGTNRRTAKI